MTTRRSRPARLVHAALTVVVAAGAVAAVSFAASGQQTATEDQAVMELRIVAPKLESGRIEFGLQQRKADGSWGDRQLPRRRFFPPTAEVDRWLSSSVVTVPPGTVATPPNNGLTAISVGEAYACGLRAGGTIVC